MTTGDVVTKARGKPLQVDLACALAAGLTAGLLTSLINVLGEHRASLGRHVSFALTAITVYMAVALALHKVWTGTLRRIVPTWALIAVVGSVLYVVIDLTPGVIKGWYDPYRMEASLIKYLSTELSAARSVMVVLTVITLPVTATLYYAGEIISAVKDWHEGSGARTSVISEQSLKK